MRTWLITDGGTSGMGRAQEVGSPRRERSRRVVPEPKALQMLQFKLRRP